jgi:hypothetical protein
MTVCFTYSNSDVAPGNQLDLLLGRYVSSVGVLFSRAGMTAIGVALVLGVHVLIVGPFYVQVLKRVLRTRLSGNSVFRSDMIGVAVIHFAGVLSSLIAWILAAKLSNSAWRAIYHVCVTT